MKIYDCFTFNNELDLLELRLNILDDVVDYFVIVEATKTHAGKDKPLYFEENKKRFKKWENKIIQITVKDMPKPGKVYFKSNWRLSSILGLGRWVPEKYQRNQIKNGLKNCKDDDIIIISDLDEIPNPKKFNKMIEYVKEGKVVSFREKLYYYYLNGLFQKNWIGTRACSYKLFRKEFNKSGDRLRRIRGIKTRLSILFYNSNKLKIIEEGGWHFSYLGDTKFILNKLSNFCHIEKCDKEDLENPKNLIKKIEKGISLFGKSGDIKFVPIDKSFPEEIIKNRKRYSKFIKKV